MSCSKPLEKWEVRNGSFVEKEMATHSSILAWKSPWTEEPGWLQSTGLHDWACVHEGGGSWVGSNNLVELKKKKKKWVIWWLLMQRFLWTTKQEPWLFFWFKFIFLLIFIFIYLPTSGLSCSMWDLVPWPGFEPRAPALAAQSLSPWTTREVLGTMAF